MNNYRLQITEEAARWFVLCSDEPSALLMKQRREFVGWLRKSPENVAEILQIARISKRMKRVQLMVGAAQLLDATVIPFPHHLSTQPVSALLAETSSPARERARVPGGIVRFAAVILACITLLCASTGSRVLQSLESESAFTVFTGAKQVKQLKLADGSTAYLSAETQISVSFDVDHRWVDLIKGDAVFEVAKDRTRPFTVRTHLIDATAVGTRFGVSVGDGVTTTVSEGVVNVSKRGSTTMMDGVNLVAGQELQSRKGFAPTVRTVDAARKLAWSSGWLVFHGDTVEEGAAAFNRFNDLRIVVDSKLTKRRLPYYRFRLHEPQEFAKAVAASPDVRLIVDRENDVMHLVPRQ